MYTNETTLSRIVGSTPHSITNRQPFPCITDVDVNVVSSMVKLSLLVIRIQQRPLLVEVLVQQNHAISLCCATKTEIANIQVLQHLVLGKEELENIQDLNCNINLVIFTHMEGMVRSYLAQRLRYPFVHEVLVTINLARFVLQGNDREAY